jgi:hypothetical protein
MPVDAEAVSRKCPPLTVEQILAWADAHHERTGRWPTHDSGPVAEAPGETWGRVNSALYEGHRGLSGRDTLARLLGRHRRCSPLAPPGRRRTWTPGEDGMVWALLPEEAARRTGRRLLEVHVRRHELGLPDVFPG